MRTQNKFKIFSQINIQLKINVMSVTDLFEAFATNKHRLQYELHKEDSLSLVL